MDNLKKYICITTATKDGGYTATAIRIVGDEILESVVIEVGPFESRQAARTHLEAVMPKSEWLRIPTTGKWRIE